MYVNKLKEIRNYIVDRPSNKLKKLELLSKLDELEKEIDELNEDLLSQKNLSDVINENYRSMSSTLSEYTEYVKELRLKISDLTNEIDSRDGNTIKTKRVLNLLKLTIILESIGLIISIIL